ncbi:hypothetical protein ACFWFZ_24970 [Streptomyces sp. NPDC060232]|uniref:hypothetical protein n=1 Tax=Streptomyces sp. NPDC060232 TaxID=3347079 RepID=UPI003650BDA0
MLLLELALHSLMDLVLWVGGKGLDRARSARRIAALRNGEPVTLRCRYRTGAQASGMQPGKLMVNRSGATLDGPRANGLQLTGPTEAATGGGRGGTVLVCATAQGERAELLLLTWDSTLVALIKERVDARA